MRACKHLMISSELFKDKQSELTGGVVVGSMVGFFVVVAAVGSKLGSIVLVLQANCKGQGSVITTLSSKPSHSETAARHSWNLSSVMQSAYSSAYPTHVSEKYAGVGS